LTGEHFFPATYFLLLPLYLTAIPVCRSCHVSYRMSPIASHRPIHILQLLFGYRVSHASRRLA
jgi:hypothetical protein